MYIIIICVYRDASYSSSDGSQTKQIEERAIQVLLPAQYQVVPNL